MVDNKIYGINYIMNFHNSVLICNDYYSAYFNMLLNFEEKYKNMEDLISNKLDPLEHNNFFTLLNEMRSQLLKSYILYKSLEPHLKNKIEEIDNHIKNIKTQMVIKREDLELYVLDINRALVDDLIQDILHNNQELIQNLYKND